MDIVIYISPGAIENDQLSALVDEVWHVRLRESPEFATVVGHHGYNDVLEDFSPEASERRQVTPSITHY